MSPTVLIPPNVKRKRQAGADSHRGSVPLDLGPFVAVLSEIEGELRRQNQWESVPPPPIAFESGLPFCCDSMRFTQWLQWVFIPHTRALADAGGPMPEASGIRSMAEEALRDCDWRTIPLVVLLDRFDRIVNKGGG